MFYITAESCRRFSLGEILIMAAMNNVESVRLGSAPALLEPRGKHRLLRTAPDPKAGAALSR
jgi:hypothetical protein